ncbi:MAG: hypothetical protein J7L89_02455 [Bacteroidales bacterium]|nr:hypothetical protein [Bacteroidales bacterium]
MKKNKLFRRLILPLIFLTLIGGCRKYDDGPLIDLYSIPKRVSGRWWFSKVLIGEADSTENYKYGNLEFGLYEKEAGGFVWDRDAYNTQSDPTQLTGGVWRLYANRDSFEMKFIDLVTHDSLFWYWKIKRLAYNEFWLERHDRDSVRIYWKLWKLVY